MAVANQELGSTSHANKEPMLASPKKLSDPDLLLHINLPLHLLGWQILVQVEKFDFHLRDWRANHSYWQITSAWFSPLWLLVTFFTRILRESSHLLFIEEIDQLNERQLLMLIASATVVGTNLYDLLMKILGSEVMRTVFSYLIRQALTRIGL
jgi:hypothetical protein